MQVANAEPVADAIGRAGFIGEVERLARCLSPTSHRMAFYCLEFEGLEPGQARKLARDFAGDCGVLGELARERYVVMRLDGLGGPAERTAVSRLAAALGTREPCVLLRCLGTWSGAVIDGAFLLEQLLESPARKLSATAPIQR